MILLTVSYITLFLLIWFKTDAFIEYAELFRIGKLVKSNEYKNKKMTEEYPLTYPRFLRMTYSCFFTQLISCPICMSVWLAIIGCFLTGIFWMFPVICISVLLLYGILCKILGLE